MRRLIIVILLLGVIFSLPITRSDIKNKAVNTVNEIKQDDITLLVLGLDESSLNTDVIFLLNFSKEKELLSVVQIPRDTYFDYGSTVNKINGYHAMKLKNGQDRNQATAELKNAIGNSLGIKIDGYISFDMESFVRIIDMVGGVEFYSPKDKTIYIGNGRAITLKSGTNILDGSDSLALVRHRKSYKTGDLGRLQMQKYFLWSAFQTMKKHSDFDTMMKLVKDGGRGIVSDLKIGDFIKYALKNKSRIEKANISFATLPGEPIFANNGISYYSLNKKSSSDLLYKLDFQIVDKFDREEKFKNKKDKNFEKIYDSDIIGYKIVDRENITSTLQN